jgi:hypothetical protein
MSAKSSASKDPDSPGEAGVEHVPVGVAPVVQRLDGLLLDAVARHHPHDERELRLEIGIAGNADGLRAPRRSDRRFHEHPTGHSKTIRPPAPVVSLGMV